jgi:hypothetical protein
MTSDDLVDAIAKLPIAAPDSARAGRTRQRCHAILDRRRQRRAHIVSRADSARHRLAPAIVGACCLFVIVYLTALLATTLGFERVLHSPPMP